jgi:hypothetical protein
MVHTAISPTEQGDRLAIRELVDAYAHCADRRDAEGQKALFTEDTQIRTEGIGPATAAIAQRVMGVDQAPKPQTDQALAAVGRVILAITTERIGPASYIPE